MHPFSRTLILRLHEAGVTLASKPMVEVALSDLKVLLQTLHLQPKLQILPMQTLLIKLQVLVIVAV